MRDPVVLVLTQEFDVTADNVVAILNERDVTVFRYDTSYFPRNSTLTSKSTDTGWLTTLVDTTHGRRSLRLEEVTSVWYRRPTPFTADPSLEPAHQEFAVKESAHAMGGIFTALPVRWVNLPAVESRAHYKPLQLKVAREVGLRIPKTLITNDPEEVSRFHRECGGAIIYKALNSGLIHQPGGWPRGLLTTALPDIPPDVLPRVRYSPCVFQELIDKAYELRITVIGEKFFAVRVDSRTDDGEPQIDSRNPLGTQRYTRTVLPVEVEKRLRRLMDAFELAYGAIDVVVDRAGEHYFLEVNPAGQFAWLDDQTPGLSLASAMADYLSGLSD
ncbi:MvdC/MvdD family ATP grasp protein [Nonomuraea sp. NPDC050643]|uniref:MvdC/MvdD family ATP grasp protein n=1 Tax=Nonomuraea sp. NPDC050643 TaxID=3155660 RepID=UPI0033FBDEE2